MLKLFSVIFISVLFFAGYRVVVHSEVARKTNSKSQVNQLEKYNSPNLMNLKGQIQNSIDSRPSLQIGVAIINLKNDEHVSLGVEAPFDAASTNKLLTAIYLLKRIDDGKESLSTKVGNHTIQAYLQQMIVDSNNEAWKDLNDYVGRDNLEIFAKTLGITTYSSATNTIAANDEAQILASIYSGELSKDSKDKLLGYMAQADIKDYIVAAVPAEYKVYHKAGWLKDRVHDAAIIDTGREAFVLVIFSKASGDYDYSDGQKLFQQITKQTINAFAGKN